MATRDQLVQTIEAAGVWAADFPRRVPHTSAAWAALDDAARAEQVARVHAATTRLGSPWPLLQALAALGEHGDASLTPRLVGLWREGAISRVACAAGRALRAIGTAEAMAELAALVDDADPYRADIAVAAVFATDPAGAYDRLSGAFTPERRGGPGGLTLPRAVLYTLAPATFRYEGALEIPTWAEPDAPAWFAADPRWLALCVGLRKDDALGDAARQVLRHAPREVVNAALDAAVAAEGPRAPSLTTRAPGAGAGDRLARYQAGAHEEVWRELRAFGAIGGDLREEALAVARETMRRVADNVERLASRLHERGWQSLTGVLHLRPEAAEAESAMRVVEDAIGAPLPASLRAYWEIVGHVDFVWNYDLDEAPPSLGLPADVSVVELDPLHLSNATMALADLDEWRAHTAGVHAEIVDPFRVGLAPDALHKANVSGGAAYAITLPSWEADPVFGGDEQSWRFVDYLRTCVRWGGFPELARLGDRAEVRAWVAEMGEGAEGF